MNEKVQTSWSCYSSLFADTEEVPASAGTFIRITSPKTRNTLCNMQTWTLEVIREKLPQKTAPAAKNTTKEQHRQAATIMIRDREQISKQIRLNWI